MNVGETTTPTPPRTPNTPQPVLIQGPAVSHRHPLGSSRRILREGRTARTITPPIKVLCRQDRRIRGDLIETFKILKGFDVINQENLFELSTQPRLLLPPVTQRDLSRAPSRESGGEVGSLLLSPYYSSSSPHQLSPRTELRRDPAIDRSPSPLLSGSPTSPMRCVPRLPSGRVERLRSWLKLLRQRLPKPQPRGRRRRWRDGGLRQRSRHPQPPY
ncbi:hypothetical protein GWK47_012584 [Chionoecetes opilio]|uniref:Uncharacterized protein n=1 Tax=Chionoecetes opilio TaxID=41210 RepID=A0A8J4XX68_CHIOP|nr:hypothetical protein GWK47_012584 [Chionoecetes opilio]